MNAGPTQDTQMETNTENQMMPSPVKMTNPMTLTMAKIVACSHPTAWHSHAEPELTGWIISRVPPEYDMKPEEIMATYKNGKKTYDIQCPLRVAAYLEELGRRKTNVVLSVDTFVDVKGTRWPTCEYLLEFTPFTGDMGKKIRVVDSVFWFTAKVESSWLGTIEEIATVVASTLAPADLRVTGVKWAFDANGARKGSIHVDFALAHPEEGFPWHKLHKARYVTLPIQPKENAAQRLTMNINPKLIKDERLLCNVGVVGSGGDVGVRIRALAVTQGPVVRRDAEPR